MDTKVSKKRDDKTKQKKKKQKLSTQSENHNELTKEEIEVLGGDQSDVELVNAVEDSEEEFETACDEIEAADIQKSEVEDFIAKLGIRELKSKPAQKIKLKVAKATEEEETEDATVAEKRKTKESKKEKTKESSDTKKKDKKLVQLNEVSSTTLKSLDIINSYKPRAYLLVRPGGIWSENQFNNDPVTFQAAPTDLVDRLQEFACRLLEDETALYRKQQEASRKSSVGWLKTVLVSGTVADKVAALVLLVQEAPVHSLPSLDSLLAMIKKKGHREALQVLDTLTELFMTDLLPENSKLKTFEQHPLCELEQLASGNKDSHDKRLLMWFYESQLKQKYANFVSTLESLSHDTVSAVRKKATAVVYQLLAERPEQEKTLLSLLVNKLGDPDYKVAAHTSHLLTKLVDQHSNMKLVVVLELERLLYRPHVSAKAQYYGICFLNQLILSHDERKLAARLISIYFTFFKVFVKKGEVESKMLSALLTGVNRAYPYAKADRENIVSQVDTLYKIVHISPFNTSLHALMLLYQVVDISDSTSDRYYMALYRKLHDPALQSSNKLSLFLNLLFKSMKNDLMERRVQAFIKRLLQVCQSFAPTFICGALLLLSEVVKARPTLLKLSKRSQMFDDNDDEEEHFVDVDEDDSENNDKKIPPTDSEMTDTATVDVKPNISTSVSSWVHRKNLGCRTSSYDPLHRNPLYCHSESECMWELLCLTQHYHPSVALFANSLLRGEQLSYTGDPLEDFTLMRFLDRFVYRNPKKNKGNAPSIQSAGGLHSVKSSFVDGVRKLPVNSDAYLQKNENEIPADESFFYRFFRQQAAAGKRREPQDVDSDADEVSDDEFDTFLDKFEQGVEEKDFYIDFAADMNRQKTSQTKKEKKTAAAAEEEEASSSGEDEEMEDNGNLSDEEIDFGSDFEMDLDDGGGKKAAGFDEEDVEFSDDDETFLPSTTKTSKKRKLSSGDGGLFAAAEDFSHLIEAETGSTLSSMVGTNAVSRKDNASAKQLKWEEDRDRWINDRNRKKSRPKHKQASAVGGGGGAKSLNKKLKSHGGPVAMKTKNKNKKRK